MPLVTDERYTPPGVLAVVRAIAPIALDPCTTADNPTGARWYFTQEQDGLARVWEPRGLVYTNPPYSRGELQRWADKVVREAFRVPDREVVVLTPCDLGTRWAKTLFEHAQAIAFWHGRIAFVRPDGEYDAGAKQPSALWYFGERAARFHRVLRIHANVVHLPTPPGFIGSQAHLHVQGGEG